MRFGCGKNDTQLEMGASFLILGFDVCELLEIV